MSNDPPRVFIFGLGYSALALAKALLDAGWEVAGTVRGPEKLVAMHACGIEALPFDRDRPLAQPRAQLARATHILSSVPPDAQGDPVLDAHRADIAACAARAGGRLAWVGYLSTTGVYGDRKGGWVDEGSRRRPTSERSRRRAAAEDAWRAVWRRHGVPVHLFRLAGIYGPGRSALTNLRNGTAQRIDKPGQRFGRIHVDDIVQVLRASMARPDPGAVYNLSDDEPAAPAEVVAYAAELLGVAPPPLVPFEAAELSAMARSFYRDNRRVRNDRIKTALGVRLKYPDYKAGLRGILAAEAARAARQRPRRRKGRQ
jgi:nucleoside-diphosphate-sugar epimerase